MGISPIKLHGVAQHQRVASAKIKFKKVVNQIHESVAEVYHVDPGVINPISSSTNLSSSVIKKAADFDRLMILIKEKLQVADF